MSGGQRRKQIAEAALRLAESGLGAVTVTAVAREVGLVPSALYRHFGGREEIVQAAFETLRAKLLDNVRRSLAAESALEGLRGFIERQLAIFRANRAVPRILFSDAVTADDSPLRPQIVQAQDAMLAGLAGLVRRGQEQGCIRADADPRDLAVLFLGQLMLPAYMYYLRRGAFGLEDQVERNWSIFRQLLTGERPSREEE